MTTKIFYIIINLFFISCSYNMDISKKEYINVEQKSDSLEPYCGDNICDINSGESYWTCLDCVDDFGNPTNGFCGDGICFNETIRDCWQDCKPIGLKNNTELGGVIDPMPEL